MFDDARAASRQARSLRRIEHRPFPLPSSKWTLGQTWEHYFWAHWQVPAESLRASVPDELEIEEYGGTAWLSMVFFRVRALRPRGGLPLPGISNFLQLNIRTYVRGPDGLPGVWFFTIDASSRLAALGVRRVYHVPAFHSRMALDLAGSTGGQAAGTRPVDRAARGGDWDGEWQEAECVRVGEAGRVFSGRYRVAGEGFHAEPGSLEWFLTERYRLFARDSLRAEMHHDQWHLCPAEAEVELTSISPFELSGDPLCHLALRQDALIWPPEPVS